MTKFNPQNERLKHDYFDRMRHAKRKSAATIDSIRKSILRYEQYTGYRHFSTFNRHRAIAFAEHLFDAKAERSGKPLSKATMLLTMQHLRSFFSWLSMQDGFRSKIHVPDIDYLSIPDTDARTARSQRHKQSPTLEQIQHVLSVMPTATDIDRRNRALIAFTIITGARDGALVSFRLKHVDIEQQLVTQDPNEVKTKASKWINTWFFPVGDDIKQILIDWIKELRNEKLYGLDDPLFPATRIGHDGSRSFKAEGLERKHWSSADPVRTIFREAFTAAGLPYYNPHSFRDTLVQLGYKLCNGNIEALKAWSQNLGHAGMLVTITSYGTISSHRQGEIIKGLS